MFWMMRRTFRSFMPICPKSFGDYKIAQIALGGSDLDATQPIVAKRTCYRYQRLLLSRLHYRNLLQKSVDRSLAKNKLF